MVPVFVREDVDAILRGLFDLNARAGEINDNVDAIRRLLGDDDEGEEEDPGGL